MAEDSAPDPAPVAGHPARALGERVALAVAAIVFLPLAVSAFLFLRLPPRAIPASRLGWPAEGYLGDPHRVLIEPGGATAWVVVTERTLGHATVHACRVDLATGRAARCHVVVALGRDESLVEILHAYGDGALLLSARSGTAPHAARSRLLVVRGDAEPRRATLEAPAGQSTIWQSDAAWNPDRRRFELFAHVSGDAPLRRAVVDADGGATPWERVEVPPALSDRLGQIVAAFPGEPMRVLSYVDNRFVLAAGDSRQSVDADVCPAPWQRDCVVVASRTPFSSYDLPRTTLWVDGAGGFVRRGAIPGPKRTDTAMRTVQVVSLADDGSARPTFVQTDAYRGEIEAPLPSGEMATFSVAVRGGEHVLSVTSSARAPRRLARRAWYVGEWSVIPWRRGVLLFGHGEKGILPLDADLAPAVRRPRLADVRAMIAERYGLDAAATVGFLGLLGAFPPLALAALAARRRSSRGASPSRWVAPALWVHACAGAWVLLTNWRYIFPPW